MILDARESLDLSHLRARYRDGTLTPAETVAGVFDRIDARTPDPAWIRLRPPDAVLADAERLGGFDPASLPLYGVPFAVADVIDVAGLPTTAGCPDFAYEPVMTAPAVQRLTDAGALLIGKTNLDPFAIGASGVRSPYGACPNAFDPAYIPGGSASGSAVAVAVGLVSFALGVDADGGGRTPAAFNNLVGLKPTRGAVSARGVATACRSLDCVSVFALTVPDAAAAALAMAGFDPADPFSRPRADPAALRVEPPPARFRFAAPLPEQIPFFGNRTAPGLFAAAVERMEALGGVAVPVDFAPFLEAGQLLLHDGPWSGERFAALGAFLEANPRAGDPVTRRIVEAGREKTAADAWRGLHRLKELARAVAPVWREADVLLTPAAGTIYTIREALAEPARLNANLGVYAAFANPLDLCALALPAGFQADGLPFGVTLSAPAFAERRLLALGAAFQASAGLPLGATGHPLPLPAHEGAPVPTDRGRFAANDAAAA